MGRRSSMALALLVLAASALSLLSASALAVTSPYVRPPTRPMLSLLQDDDDGGQTPQQVHVRFRAVHLILVFTSSKLLQFRCPLH
ncbi:unnamed protein product [Urochloa humidicola]